MSNAVHEWPGTVLALNDLQRLGPNLRELIVADKVVLTPCARDEIKRLGVSLVRRETKKETSIGYGSDGLYPQVATVVLALGNEGFTLKALQMQQGIGSMLLGKTAGEMVASGVMKSAVLFCREPEAAACAANKLVGIRAAAVNNMMQAKRACSSLGANMMVVEMPGRTYFEIRQVILLMMNGKGCPEGSQALLERLDARS
jgi:ribose 5-phosphate isomerase RpiB